MGHVGRNYILFLCMELRGFARFWGLDKKFISSRFCDVPAVNAVLLGLWRKFFARPVPSHGCTGSLDCVRLAPHSAQDDSYGLGGVSVTV